MQALADSNESNAECVMYCMMKGTLK